MGEAKAGLGTAGAGVQVGTVRLGRQDAHTRPCFTQTQDIHFPRPLHRQQTGPADLETPVDVSFVWPAGKRLLVRLSTRLQIWPNPTHVWFVVGLELVDVDTALLLKGGRGKT